MDDSASSPGSALASVLLAVGLGAPVLAAETPLRSAAPLEPIAAIIDAFRSHRVVALYDAHGNEQAHAFLLSLIRDPRLPAHVNDIVVGIGNARYQELMDRYVRGEEVPQSAMTETRLSAAVCSEPGYLEMRLKRIAVAGIPRPVADELKKHCSAEVVK